MTYAAFEWIIVLGVVGVAAALMFRELAGWIKTGTAAKNGGGASTSGACGGCASGCERSTESVPPVALVPLNLDFKPDPKQRSFVGQAVPDE